MITSAALLGMESSPAPVDALLTKLDCEKIAPPPSATTHQRALVDSMRAEGPRIELSKMQLRTETRAAERCKVDAANVASTAASSLNATES